MERGKGRMSDVMYANGHEKIVHSWQQEQNKNRK